MEFTGRRVAVAGGLVSEGGKGSEACVDECRVVHSLLLLLVRLAVHSSVVSFCSEIRCTRSYNG